MADLRRRLAASEEKARTNQMVRDYEERGVSTFRHDRGQMAHVFHQIILPHIVDRPTRVYFENLDWNEAEPEELEELEAHWPTLQQKICALRGVPYADNGYRKNPSSHAHYSRYYDDRTRALVAQYMGADLTRFGYAFESEPAAP